MGHLKNLSLFAITQRHTLTHTFTLTHKHRQTKIKLSNPKKCFIDKRKKEEEKVCDLFRVIKNDREKKVRTFA